MGSGVLLLLAGAEALVRGASALALRFGVSPLVVGLTVVAIGTSSPELVVSLQAALAGQGGVAVGNVVGSNVANLGLIVGLSCLLAPMTVDRKLVRNDVPVMLAAMGAMTLFLLDGSMGRIEGAALALGAVVYTVQAIRTSRRESRAVREVDLPPEVEAALAERSVSTGKHLLFVVGGVALLVYGSDLLLNGAIEAAVRFGVSEAVIGLTLVALGTSLPELATTIVGALRGQGEIALGNALGSNIFNSLGVLGPTALVAPIVGAGVGTATLGLMMAFGALTLVILITGGQTRRWEGAVLLAAYVAYIAYVV